MLAAPLGITKKAWTAGAYLPGGDLHDWIGKPQRPDTDFARLVLELARRHPQLDPRLCHRLARAYGSRVGQVLEPGLGNEVAPGLHEGELHYLHQHEWARSADDVLWRRSKLGLHLTAAQRARVVDWCEAHWTDTPAHAAAAAAARMETAWN
jgi:glycerol-3-phosphate dehydrogenase